MLCLHTLKTMNDFLMRADILKTQERFKLPRSDNIIKSLKYPNSAWDQFIANTKNPCFNL